VDTADVSVERDLGVEPTGDVSVEPTGDVSVEPTGDVSVEPTGDVRVAEESRPLYRFEHDALATLFALVIAHTRATDADVIAHTRATAADLGVRDAQLNRLLVGCGIDNIHEFNVQVGKHLYDLEAADEVSGRQSAGWGRPSAPWNSLYDAVAWAALVFGGLFVFWQVVLI
jgi:hypothetical protein